MLVDIDGGERLNIVDLSFLELSIYLKSKGEIGDARHGKAIKPEGKPLFSYGGFFDTKLKVYNNGILGPYARLTKITNAMGTFHMRTMVAVDERSAFVPFYKLDGIYPLEISYTNPSGNVFPNVGVQVETKDHRTMVFTFGDNPRANQQRFKAALRSFYGLYNDGYTVRGASRITGTSQNPMVQYQGDVHRPRLLREARDVNSGSPTLKNSQLRPEVVLTLDVNELNSLAFPEWVDYWVYWLQGTRKALGASPTEKQLEKRASTLQAIIDRLEEAMEYRRDFGISAELLYTIADELVDLHCTHMVGDSQVVRQEVCDLAEDMVNAAMKCDPKMVDEFDLLGRIGTLRRQR